MSKKKFDGILKGLAAAGVVTGGAGIVQDTDVVFAAENTEAGNDSEVVIEDEQQETVSTFAMQRGNGGQQTQSDKPTPPGLSDKPADPEDKPADPEDKPADPEDKPADPEDKPADPEDKPADPEDKPADPEEDKAGQNSNSKNEVIFSSETQKQQEIVGALLDSYDENGKLSSWTSATITNEDGTTKNVSGSFYRSADDLAVSVIKDYYNSKEISANVVGDWVSNSNEKNYVKFQYEMDGVSYTEYFDYITVDKDENALIDATTGKESTNANSADTVGGIQILKKEVEYQSGMDGNGETHILTWEKIEKNNGDVEIVYYVDGKHADKSDENAGHKDYDSSTDTYTIKYKGEDLVFEFSFVALDKSVQSEGNYGVKGHTVEGLSTTIKLGTSGSNTDGTQGGSETGSGDGSETGSGDGSEGGSGDGSETGSESGDGSGSGSGDGSESGSEGGSGSETGSGDGSETGSGDGSEGGSGNEGGTGSEGENGNNTNNGGDNTTNGGDNGTNTNGGNTTNGGDNGTDTNEGNTTSGGDNGTNTNGGNTTNGGDNGTDTNEGNTDAGNNNATDNNAAGDNNNAGNNANGGDNAADDNVANDNGGNNANGVNNNNGGDNANGVNNNNGGNNAVPVAPVANIAAANVPAGDNVAPAALTTIEDDQVPLAVNNEDDADTDANDAAELTTIEDEEVAKAAGIPADGLQNAWGWIAGVAAVALGKGAVDIKARKAKNQEKENDDTK